MTGNDSPWLANLKRMTVVERQEGRKDGNTAVSMVDSMLCSLKLNGGGGVGGGGREKMMTYWIKKKRKRKSHI